MAVLCLTGRQLHSSLTAVTPFRPLRLCLACLLISAAFREISKIPHPMSMRAKKKQPQTHLCNVMIICKIPFLTGINDELKKVIENTREESLGSRSCCSASLCSPSPSLLMGGWHRSGVTPEASAASHRGKGSAAVAGGDSPPTRVPPPQLYPLLQRRRGSPCGRDW